MIYGFRRYHDERDKRFNKLCESMGYERPKIVSGQLSMEECQRDPHQRPRLLQLLERLQAGDVLVIEKLSDVAELPSKLPELLGKLSGTPATVFIAELSRHQPVEVYANILSLASAHFAKLEDKIASLKEQLETTNERVDDYVQASAGAIARHYQALYKDGPKALVQSLLSPPVNLTTTEPFDPDAAIVEVLERGRKARDLTYMDVAKLLDRSVSSVHRAFTTGRATFIGDIIDLLLRPARSPLPNGCGGNGTVEAPAAPEPAPAARPADPAWKDGAPATVHHAPGSAGPWVTQQSEEE